MVGEKFCTRTRAHYAKRTPLHKILYPPLIADYVFLRRVPRCTIIAKTSNWHQKVGCRQDYKYRKLHADTPKTLTVVLSLVQTRKINYRHRVRIIRNQYIVVYQLLAVQAKMATNEQFMQVIILQKLLAGIKQLFSSY